jgi:hypothetical protein
LFFDLNFGVFFSYWLILQISFSVPSFHNLLYSWSFFLFRRLSFRIHAIVSNLDLFVRLVPQNEFFWWMLKQYVAKALNILFYDLLSFLALIYSLLMHYDFLLNNI